MEIVCPRCGTKSRELMSCERCETIGCTVCMKKNYGKWVCHSCENPNKHYYGSDRKSGDVTSAFSAMFG